MENLLKESGKTMEMENSLTEIGETIESSLKESSLTERFITLVEKHPIPATLLGLTTIGGLIYLGHQAIKSPKQTSIEAGPIKVNL